MTVQKYKVLKRQKPGGATKEALVPRGRATFLRIVSKQDSSRSPESFLSEGEKPGVVLAPVANEKPTVTQQTKSFPAEEIIFFYVGLPRDFMRGFKNEKLPAYMRNYLYTSPPRVTDEMIARSLEHQYPQLSLLNLSPAQEILGDHKTTLRDELRAWARSEMARLNIGLVAEPDALRPQDKAKASRYAGYRMSEVDACDYLIHLALRYETKMFPKPGWMVPWREKNWRWTPQMVWENNHRSLLNQLDDKSARRLFHAFTSTTAGRLTRWARAESHRLGLPERLGLSPLRQAKDNAAKTVAGQSVPVTGETDRRCSLCFVAQQGPLCVQPTGGTSCRYPELNPG